MIKMMMEDLDGHEEEMGLVVKVGAISHGRIESGRF
jgi:hypothetical protein